MGHEPLLIAGAGIETCSLPDDETMQKHHCKFKQTEMTLPVQQKTWADALLAARGHTAITRENMRYRNTQTARKRQHWCQYA